MKAQYGTPKRQGGISLLPALWERIDETARKAGVPRNRVMENVLMREFGLSGNLQNSSGKSRTMQVLQDEPVRLAE